MTDMVSGRPTIDTSTGIDAARDEPPTESLSQGESLRGRLRDETRPAHERLDASFAALASGDKRDYASFLRVNAACLARIEPLLEDSPLAEAMPELGSAPRRAAADADIEALGLRPIAPSPFPIGRPSLAEAVGIAYVVEGSRLGARMILKQMRKNGAKETDEPLPTFFLEAAGEPERFRRFLGMAEALVASRSERDAAVRAAEATFGYFLDAVREARAVNHDGGAN